jgi:glyoxylase-like metal-dependent hydrolase (beta-lactamase superfamily II)
MARSYDSYSLSSAREIMAEVQLTRLGESTYVAEGPTNIGVFVAQPGQAGQPGRAVLVDSGNDDDAGKRILRACDAAGFKVSHIANTHSNADHCGANALVQARTGCRIAAPRMEAAFIEEPIREAAFLWGGFPPPQLRNKFLVAKCSRVTDLLEAPCSVPETGIEAIPLPGHFLGQVGYLTPDRVFFAADAAASPAILAKYKYYVVYDVAAHLATLDMLARLDVDWIVPSHAKPTREAGPLVEANKATILGVGDRILELCSSIKDGPVTTETLVARLADSFGIELNHTQHALLGMTLRSYLSWLADKDLVTSHLDANRLVFERK